MQVVTQEEFDAIEQLLADLLPHCDAEEEIKLIGLYARFEAIRLSLSDLSSARDRLIALQSQKVR